MTSELETNIVAVERTKEYIETPNEVTARGKPLLLIITSRHLMLLMTINLQATGLLRAR